MSMHDKHPGGAIRIRCSTNRESGSCSNSAKVRLDLIEKAIADRLREVFMDRPEHLQAYVEAYLEERQSDIRAARKNKQEIDRQLADAS